MPIRAQMYLDCGDNASQKNESALSGRRTMNRPELLLVDDDPIAIEVLSHMLGGFARLRFARTGQEALRLVRERSPDLMLLDVDLPGLSGIEVLQHLQADSAQGRFPVVMI